MMLRPRSVCGDPRRKRAGLEARGVYGKSNATGKPMEYLERWEIALRKDIGKKFLTELTDMKRDYDRLYAQAQFLFVELLMSEKDQILGKEMLASTKITKVSKRIVSPKGWADKTQAWKDSKNGGILVGRGRLLHHAGRFAVLGAEKDRLQRSVRIRPGVPRESRHARRVRRGGSAAMFRGNASRNSSRGLASGWMLKAASVAAALMDRLGIGGLAAGTAPAVRLRRRRQRQIGRRRASKSNANYFCRENRKDVSPADQERADKLRRKTIASIRDLLDSKKAASAASSCCCSLGELHVERHDYLRDQELTKFEKSWDAWKMTSVKDGLAKAGVEPKTDYTGSEGELTKAANAFRQLVTEFPKHPRTDAALYSLAKTLARLGKDTSVDYYKQLMARVVPEVAAHA